MLRSKVRVNGTLRLVPKTLPLIAVQRQAAASRSARPLMRAQHGCTGGEPTVTFTKPSTLAHTPSLRVSMGHLPADGVGEGVGFGFGLGQEQGQEPQALTTEKKRMLSAKKRASDADVFEAISLETLGASCLKYKVKRWYNFEDGEFGVKGGGFIVFQEGNLVVFNVS
ncbi:hypothetical protein V6N11_081864 [Hibiscus sabdariffa]|uniref:Uncharacterized protein n=1 Tax=Hibiscus sabdariffa TaxID=183260 RepID=A0ABR2Q7G5_9ROSI